MEKSHLVPENAPVHKDIGWNEPLFNKHVLGSHGESDVHHDLLPTSRGDVSSLGGGRATPNHHLAKSGVSRCEASDYRAMIQRVNEHFTVGS